MRDFLGVLIPLFVAIGAPGVLPTYFSLTEHLGEPAKRQIVRQSVVTALAVTMGFALLGRAVFQVLQIRVEDFMIAGGILLLVFAVNDLLSERNPEPGHEGERIGVVPLGTPLIAGPATLTAALMLVGTHGLVAVFLALVLNLAVAWLILAQANRLIRVMGISGSRAIAKVSSLLLAAYGVSMVRGGVFSLLS